MCSMYVWKYSIVEPMQMKRKSGEAILSFEINIYTCKIEHWFDSFHRLLFLFLNTLVWFRSIQSNRDIGFYWQHSSTRTITGKKENGNNNRKSGWNKDLWLMPFLPRFETFRPCESEIYQSSHASIGWQFPFVGLLYESAEFYMNLHWTLL